jgi:hypothetical protein
VENIPGQAERDSGVGQKVFGFSPESCSASPRNAVRLQPGILFDLPRNAVRLAPEYAKTANRICSQSLTLNLPVKSYWPVFSDTNIQNLRALFPVTYRY